MSNDCRPPKDTPDGTVCNIVHCLERPDRPPVEMTWFGGGDNAERWEWLSKSFSVERITAMGFRFHSLANPQDGTA